MKIKETDSELLFEDIIRILRIIELPAEIPDTIEMILKNSDFLSLSCSFPELKFSVDTCNINVLMVSDEINYCLNLLAICLDNDDLAEQLEKLIRHVEMSQGITKNIILITSHWSNKAFAPFENRFTELGLSGVRFCVLLITPYRAVQVPIIYSFHEKSEEIPF